MKKENTHFRDIQPDVLTASRSKRKQTENLDDQEGLQEQPAIAMPSPLDTHSEQNFKLFSINKARKLLQVSRETLMSYINSGRLGTFQAESGRMKIPAGELHRFINENTIRERKVSLIGSLGNRDITEFMNGKNIRPDHGFDSTALFNKHMERIHGQCI